MSRELQAAVNGESEPDARYLLREKLGSGASAEVWALYDRVLLRTLALKRMRPDYTAKRGTAFLREARLLASLDHPAIPAVYDYGRDAEGRPYLVMQRFQGLHMGRVLRDRGPIRSGATLLALLEQLARIAEALHHAHGLGYLHLDLKPGNLVTGPFEQLWLVDWGNALSRKHWDRCFDRPIGTLSYMSPEQAIGGPFDVRTDVYGLGACLFSILAGHAPLVGTREERLAHLVHRRPVPRLTEEVTALIPESLLTLVYRCLAPDPEDRPQSADALRSLLMACRRGTDVLPRRFAAAGSTIATEGDPGDVAWYVVHGSIDVVQRGRGVVRTVGAGEVLGELAPLLGRPRTATLRARENCVLSVITGDYLRDPSTMGPIGAQIFEAIARRLLDAERPLRAQRT